MMTFCLMGEAPVEQLPKGSWGLRCKFEESWLRVTILTSMHRSVVACQLEEAISIARLLLASSCDLKTHALQSRLHTPILVHFNASIGYIAPSCPRAPMDFLPGVQSMTQQKTMQTNWPVRCISVPQDTTSRMAPRVARRLLYTLRVHDKGLLQSGWAVGSYFHSFLKQ